MIHQILNWVRRSRIAWAAICITVVVLPIAISQGWLELEQDPPTIKGCLSYDDFQAFLSTAKTLETKAAGCPGDNPRDDAWLWQKAWETFERIPGSGNSTIMVDFTRKPHLDKSFRGPRWFRSVNPVVSTAIKTFLLVGLGSIAGEAYGSRVHFTNYTSSALYTAAASIVAVVVSMGMSRITGQLNAPVRPVCSTTPFRVKDTLIRGLALQLCGWLWISGLKSFSSPSNVVNSGKMAGVYILMFGFSHTIAGLQHTCFPNIKTEKVDGIVYRVCGAFSSFFQHFWAALTPDILRTEYADVMMNSGPTLIAVSVLALAIDHFTLAAREVEKVEEVDQSLSTSEGPKEQIVESAGSE